jgi:hypothetical protein
MGISRFKNLFLKLTPSVKKEGLYLFAGLMWSGVGIYLSSLTIEWFRPVDKRIVVFFVAVGLVLAFLIYWFGFSTFALRNIQRIELIPKLNVCIFAFQQWTSYPLVVFMISLGIFLRKYSPLPKTWLGTMYLGIGGSLFLASYHYYRKILDLRS